MATRLAEAESPEGAPPEAIEQKKQDIRKRLESLPFSIIDEQWPGNDFFDIDHLGQNTVIRYNTRHPFFTQIYAKILQAAGLAADGAQTGGAGAAGSEELAGFAKGVQLGIDLVMVGYAKAEAMDDEEGHDDIYSFLRAHWGLHLKQLVEKRGVEDLVENAAVDEEAAESEDLAPEGNA